MKANKIMKNVVKTTKNAARGTVHIASGIITTPLALAALAECEVIKGTHYVENGICSALR